MEEIKLSKWGDLTRLLREIRKGDVIKIIYSEKQDKAIREAASRINKRSKLNAKTTLGAKTPKLRTSKVDNPGFITIYCIK